MKAALISNKLSRYNARYPNRVEAIAKSYELATFTLNAEALANIMQIDAMLERAADSGTEILCINGGDGTLDLILTRLFVAAFSSWRPLILLLRGGTTNMTHRDVGYGKDPAEALKKAIAREFQLSITKRHIMRVSGGNMTTPHYGFFIGTHALTRAITHTRTHLHSKGNHGTLSEIRMLFSSLSALLRGDVTNHPILSPTLLSFSLHSAMRHTMHVTFIATTLERLLLNLTLSKPRNQIGCLALQQPFTGLFTQLASLWTGKGDKDDGAILRWRDDEIRFALDGNFTIDGEIFSAELHSPVTITKSESVSFLQ